MPHMSSMNFEEMKTDIRISDFCGKISLGSGYRRVVDKMKLIKQHKYSSQLKTVKIDNSISQ